MKSITKKNKQNAKNNTKKITGGIGPLVPLSAEKEIEQRKRAIDLIKQILIATNDGEDIIRIGEPKESGRVKKTGVNAKINKVFVGDESLDRRDLSYMLAELTGYDKFRIDHSTTSGEYKGKRILGKRMRNVADMMMGFVIEEKGKVNKLFGVKDFIEFNKDEYNMKYLTPRPLDVNDPLDADEVDVPKKKGVLNAKPLHNIVADDFAEAIDPLLKANLDKTPVVLSENEPFMIEEDRAFSKPATKKIRTKIVMKKDEPIYEEQQEEPEKTTELVIVEKPVSETVQEQITEILPETQSISPDSSQEDMFEAEPELKSDAVAEFEIERGSKVPKMKTDNKLLEKEKNEYDYNKLDSSYNFLYPDLNDPNFNIKIAKRKEFSDTKYDGTIYDIRKQAEIMCKTDFELMPHQLFVKNFLSFQTPYNSLLLYHNLGSGKTCSAIGVSEEMRTYMKQLGITQRIIIVASPNVQQNFRMQLFDESKLEEINGLWNLNTCVGNALLKEINPTNLKDVPRERIISQVNSIIHSNYVFMGYTELANYITKVINVDEESGFSTAQKKSLQIRKIKKNFDNRLIIIDEVHNIRRTDDNKDKRTADLLLTICKNANNMRLLLLSATPMYNSYKEIIWLINLINANDKRATISLDDVFDKEGNFKPERVLEDGRVIEGGKELLIRKLTGYVSYVRGENPYTFPYRIYPSVFSPDNLIKNYPKVQMNKKQIETPIKDIPVYVTSIGEYQQHGYDYIMEFMRNKSFNKTNAYGVEIQMPSFENMESFGYTLLQQPLESLNIVYPSSSMDKIIQDVQMKAEDKKYNYSAEEGAEIISNIVGKKGLSRIMNYMTMDAPYPLRYDFEYKPEVIKKYGRIFNRQHIGKYSNKIAKICECIMNSTGIVLIYSQYIDGGVVPIALALEEMGFNRYGSANYTKPLFKTPPVEPLDSITLKPKSEVAENFKQASYVMITGDKYFSPNNADDIKFVTNKNNKNGEQVKVILISKAGSEGLDFKNIRQIHILEPWYNMNRIEQIVGRGVRNLSHCSLPFEDRNVELYLHGTMPRNDEEPADLYVYRLAEKKAKEIGQVTRILKETSVDCLLNIGQTNFTVEKLLSIAENKNIKINLGSRKTIDYQIGDKPFTDICDYMDNCNFTCSPNAEIKDEDIIKDTYNEDFVKMNYSMILKRIREMFREQSFYKWEQIEATVNAVKKYPVEQIYYTLTQFIDNKNEYLLDKYGRRGYLVNKGEIYAFQPVEVTDENASIFDRSIPVDFKHEAVLIKLPEKRDATLQMSMKPDAEEEKDRSYEELVEQIEKNIEIALNPKTEIETGDTDWYKHASRIINLLNDKRTHDVPLTNITRYIIYHALDEFSFDEKMLMLKKMYTVGFKVERDFEKIIMSYFDSKIVEYKMLKGIVLAKENICKIYIQSGENLDQWTEAKQTEKQKLSQLIIDRFVIPPVKYHGEVVGFMHMFKKRDIVFKLKDTKVERSTGAKLENEKKGDIIKQLNKVLKEDVYTSKNTLKILKNGLCVMIEMLLRFNTDTTSKVQFFDVEKTIMNRV